MKDYHFIGIDIAKDKFDVGQRSSKRTKQFLNKASGFKKFYDALQAIEKTPWVIMESTGIYGEALADFLTDKNIRVSVVNPYRVKHLAKSLLQRNKNDSVDARVIAEYGELKKPKLYVKKTAENKALRELLQVIDMLNKQLTQWKNKLHSATTEIGKKAIKREIQRLERELAKCKKQADALAKQDAQMVEQLELIQSIKGVGPETAIRILGYLPNLETFQSAKQLAAYIGVSPRQRQSGNFIGKTSMSKTGEAHIRRALYMPALSAMRANQDLQPFINRLRDSGHKAMEIIGAVMRKLVHWIFGILKSGLPFDSKLA